MPIFTFEAEPLLAGSLNIYRKFFRKASYIKYLSVEIQNKKEFSYFLMNYVNKGDVISLIIDYTLLIIRFLS